MLTTYENPIFKYTLSEEQQTGTTPRRPVIVVGAGPVGLCIAIDLAKHGTPVIVLDEDNTVSVGSRAMGIAKRTLEILDRLGCGEHIVRKGVEWNIAKVFLGDRLVYTSTLAPTANQRRPAFINLQQYYFEEYLVDHARGFEGIDLRWKNRVIAVTPASDHVKLTASTPDGDYQMECEYLVAADGARSSVRQLLGLKSQGKVFQDRFLIADVVMKADFPPERWFWFDPPFHDGQSALLHRQADNVWRIDFQLGWDADPTLEKKRERVIPRLKAMLGEDRRFELEWVSVYTFTCRRLERFRHGRVLFVGDAAHQVSPFGARGANSGIQDADNLAWKLNLVLSGDAPAALLDSYDAERIPAADEDILSATRSTEFVTPKSAASRAFRDAVLELSERYPFARALVNTGRLSVPAVLGASPLNTADRDHFDGAMVPGAPCRDAPVTVAGQPGWLLASIGGGFVGLYFNDEAEPTRSISVLEELDHGSMSFRMLEVMPKGRRPRTELRDSDISTVLIDHTGLVAEHYDGRPGTFYLIRPDQHVVARWRSITVRDIRSALLRATAQELP